MSFSKVSPLDLDINPFKMIGNNWYLLTSGTEGSYNTMTASWGHMGEMWGSPSFACYVRPSRYTFGFIEENEIFSVCFFDEKYKSALNFCGSHSGKDCDKAKETGLTPVSLNGTTVFEEANLVFICKKQYSDYMEEGNVLDKAILKFYSSDPYHKLFIGQIITAYKKG